MENFNRLFESLLLKESVIILSYPSNGSFKDSYDRVNTFVNSGQFKPVSEIIASLELEKIKQLNMTKDQVDKIVNLTKKQIPGLNNVTVEYLFLPSNLVASLYNAANNADKDPKRYELIVEAYKTYKNNPTSDSLASLIVAINTSDQSGKLASLVRATINGMIKVVPGTGLVATILAGSIAQSSTNLLPLTTDLNNVGNNVAAVKNYGLMPGTILEDITKQSVKGFSMLSVGAFASNAGDKALTKAKELADKTKEKSKELLNKTKEELSKYADKSGANFFDMTHSNRKPGSMATNRVNLRGAAGQTTPAKY